MFSQFENHGPSKPNTPGDEAHRPHHPDKPHPPADPNPPERPEKPNTSISVIVNGVDKVLPVGTKQLSYEDVVRLAYGKYTDATNIIYSIAYSNGPAENKKGTLVKGDAVLVREGMVFNVGCSNKS